MSMDTEAATSAQQNRVFKKIIVEYLPPDLCAYKYKGKPYFSIKYTENGEEHIGYGTYNPNILTEYLIKYFMPSDQDEPSFEAIKEYCNKRCLSIVDNALLREYASAQHETCEGCKHFGKWENEVEYGYPSPCTCCKRRVEDHYERCD